MVNWIYSFGRREQGGRLRGVCLRSGLLAGVGRIRVVPLILLAAGIASAGVLEAQDFVGLQQQQKVRGVMRAALEKQRASAMQQRASAMQQKASVERQKAGARRSPRSSAHTPGFIPMDATYIVVQPVMVSTMPGSGVSVSGVSASGLPGFALTDGLTGGRADRLGIREDEWWSVPGISGALGSVIGWSSGWSSGSSTESYSGWSGRLMAGLTAGLNPLGTHGSWPPSCPPLTESFLAPLISAAAQSYQLDPELLREVARQESAFRPCSVSSKGAQGLMQLMPATQRMLKVNDPFDPQESIFGGAQLLSILLDRYGGDLALALSAYNAGTSRVDASGGIPPIPETQSYVANILRRLGTLPD